MAKTEEIGKGKPGPGRPPGSLNKTTKAARDIIQGCADKLGGMERLVAWAKEDPANERVFWASIFPKLVPLDVTTGGEKIAVPVVTFQSSPDA